MRIQSVVDVVDRLAGHTVLVRSSLNVPVEAGRVTNPFRLEAALSTISLLSARGVKVVLLSHIGDTPAASLRPVYEYLKKKIEIQFVDDVVGARATAAARGLKNGEVLLLENLRRDPGEIKNSDDFARRLATLGDVYVNDDFAAAHRSHASLVGVPKYMPSYAGLQFEAELSGLVHALAPKSPSLAILGGAKFVTKEPLIRALLTKYDTVFVGGALATDFFKAKGYEVGRSLTSAAPHIQDLLQNSKIMLPEDVTVQSVSGQEVKKPSELLPSDCIYDIGPVTLTKLTPYIEKGKTVLWNGPMGNFEKGYSEMTEALARIVAGAAGVSVVGGGDTIASIEKLGLNKKFEFLSTAGGAMLDFLAHGTLPGIEALKNAKKLA
jgi:phosphoglycerate kinase